MRTTVDLPDELYRDVKTAALRRGVPMKMLVREAVADYLSEPAVAPREPAWKKHVGTLDREAGEELRRFVETADFSRVDPADAASAAAPRGQRKAAG